MYANSQGLIIESFSLVLQYNNTIQTDVGLFDKLFGGKNKNNNEFVRANSNDCEDIGKVTHFKGKPLTGVLFELNDNSQR